MNPKTAFLKGLRTISPMFLGALPFGLVAGVTAATAGLTAVQGVGFSFFLFAGASQLAALQLIRTGASLIVVLFTIFVINLRHIMYSASLAPHFQTLPLGWRLFLPFLMADQPYALSIIEMDARPDMPYKEWFFLGMGGPLWLMWICSTTVGVLVGAQIPPEWALDFIVPLVFLVLIFPSVKDRAGVFAAVVAGVTAVVARPLPYNLGLITAAVIGIIAGVVVELAINHKP